MGMNVFSINVPVPPPVILGIAFLVRSQTSHTTGKFYHEITINVASVIGQVGVGLDNDAENLAAPAGQIGSVCWVGDGSVNYNGRSRVYIASPFLVGSVLGIASDLTNDKIYFTVNGTLWNNSASADPVAGIGGFGIPSVGPNVFALAQLAQAGDQVTANFTGTPAFTHTAPTGYSAWG